jgi:hypothetical protein
MRKLLIGIAIATLLISCSPVPYDPGLAGSAGTVAKMIQDNHSSVTLYLRDNPSDQILAFYPRLTATGFDYGTGFIVSASNLHVRAGAMSTQGGSGALSEFGSFSTLIPNQNQLYPSWSAWPTKDAPAYNAWLGLVTFDSLSPLANNSLAAVEVQIGSPPVFFWQGPSSLHDIVLSQTGFDGVVLGASVDADTDLTRDYSYWLVRESAGSSFSEFSSPVWSSGTLLTPLRSSGYPYALSFIPASITRLQYFHDENQAADPARHPNASFASWYDGLGGWICYRWAEDPPDSRSYTYAKLPIDHRIDAMLSTGQLLSTEDGTGRLYDRDGNLLASFPLGTLRFLSEEYVGGQARTYFSQLLLYDGEQHFNVYWIRTDALTTLGS